MLLKTLRAKNIACGWLYFYVHFATEVVCFYCLSKQTGDSVFLWLYPFVYDALAFVPQSLVGFLSDRFPKIKFGVIGLFLTAVAALMLWLLPDLSAYIPLVILCLGNVFVHVNGAETTLRSSGGKLSHSAIFVAGGSFGVITGRVLAKSIVPYWAISLLTLTAIPFSLLAETYRSEEDEKPDRLCAGFNYASTKISPKLVVFLAVFIVVVRGYMGYGIPTAWNKTVVQSVALYCAMGIGKAMGGIVADTIGIKKTAVLSALLAVPFLLEGNERMFVSIIGVMFFSMTMSITLALLVSVMKTTPGLAFGWTTIGLFLGTAPIFFFKFTTVRANSILIIVLSALSILAMLISIRKDGEPNEQL